MKRTLLLMRHAKSSWDTKDVTDFERPLNSRGQRDAPRMGRWLKSENILPDCIYSSSAVRTAATASIVSHLCGYTKEIILTPALYEASCAGFAEFLQQVPAAHTTILVVSHNPLIEELIELMTGEYCELPTSAIVKMEADVANWADIATHNDLTADITTPKLLDLINEHQEL
jgi:phosphohistidine phosphatase